MMRYQFQSAGLVAAKGAILALYVAALINWHVEWAPKLLAFLAFTTAYFVLTGMDALHDRLIQIEHWCRLLFLASHIRNEHDGLPRAADRLLEDQAIDRENAEAARREAVLSSDAATTVMLLVCAVTLGGLLHFGTFGEIGKGWLDGLLRAVGLQ